MSLWNGFHRNVVRGPGAGPPRTDRGTGRDAPLRLERLEDRSLPSADVVIHWNQVAMQATTNAPPSQVPVFRNLAVVQAAVFDAVDAIDRSYTPYATPIQASRGASKEAAAAQAAHDTLSALYPEQQATFDAALAADLAGIPPGLANQGVAVGRAAAQQMLDLRANDGSGASVPYAPTPGPGVWQPTPPNFAPATTAHIPLMPPFALPSSSLFRAPPPPALTSAEYAADYNYTKEVGALHSATRTPEQTNQSLDWRPPLVNIQTWNVIAQEVAEARGNTLVQNARMFALLNMAMNDALETSYGSKFQYGLWRPVTAIRNGGLGGANDTAGNPLADGNPDTVGDPTWLPLHPTTPAFPTYSGNAATEGAVSSTMLASFFGTDAIPFQVRWAFSGETRSYPSFSAAAHEEADSRIFGGIHFRFDTAAGHEIGRQVADYVFGHVLLPRPEPSRVRAAGASMALVQPAAGAPPAGEALAVPTGGEARAVVFPPFAPPPTTGANFGADPGPQAVPAPAAIAPTPTGSEQPNTASPAPHPGAAPALSRAAIDPAFDDPWGDRLSGAFVDGPAPTQTG